MESKDRVFDTMLREEIRRLNAHLPKSRRTIRELLREETPSVTTVDGERIVMKRSELEQLTASLPEEARDKVRLPLVLLRRDELGPGAFTLLGDTLEEFALCRIVSGFQGTYEEFKRTRGGPNIFYKPQISDLLRRYHSLVVMGFGVSGISER
jgi:uncharacterized protein (UPF0216 family)